MLDHQGSTPHVGTISFFTVSDTLDSWRIQSLLKRPIPQRFPAATELWTPRAEAYALSVLFRTKESLTFAQLVSAWARELAGDKVHGDHIERDLGHLLLEDIINGRLDNAGPPVDGRQLGLRIITPENRAGFLEGRQVSEVTVAGGLPAYISHRIVVLKEAVLDFARRRDLPPPSWWADVAETLDKQKNKLATSVPTQTSEKTVFQAARVRKTPKESRPVDSEGRRRGRSPIKLERVKQSMKRDIQAGRHTVTSLRGMLEKSLAETYCVSRDTARKARKAFLSEFVENSNSDK
jgi:hypothetical protein